MESATDLINSHFTSFTQNIKHRCILFLSKASVNHLSWLLSRQHYELLLRICFINRTFLSSLTAINMESVAKPIRKQHESSCYAYE